MSSSVGREATSELSTRFDAAPTTSEIDPTDVLGQLSACEPALALSAVSGTDSGSHVDTRSALCCDMASAPQHHTVGGKRVGRCKTSDSDGRCS
jgi:hypothetical protein